MPTIRQHMHRYNELVQIARRRGFSRGPDGALLHELTNLRVSNAAAARRVNALAIHIGVFQTDVGAAASVAARRYLLPSATSSSIAPLPAAPAAPPILPAANTSAPTFGIEIECLFPATLNSRQIAQGLSAAGLPTEVEMYNHSPRGHWKIVTDASLSSNPGTHALEVVSPVLTGAAGLEQIAKICKLLGNEAGGLGAIVNRSCGLHVHVGISNDLDNVHFFRQLVRLYKQHLPLIERVLAPSRRQAANHYSRDFHLHTEAQLERCQSVTDVIRLVNGPEPRSDRHYKVNLNAYFRHRTVEFRQHQGTLDPQKATMWTRFCLKLVAAAAKTATLATSRTLAELLEQIEASPEEKTYFIARQAHFQQLENQGDV